MPSAEPLKTEVDAPDEVVRWLSAPGPAVFQGLDLLAHSAAIAERPLRGCAFFGCTMSDMLREAAGRAECLVVPSPAGLPFEPFRRTLYTADELFAGFDPLVPESVTGCLDWRIYESFVDPTTRRERPTNLDATLMRRMHDASVSDALQDFMDGLVVVGGVTGPRTLRAVAVMGGHDVARADPQYEEVARLSLSVAQAGYIIVTGGGPGLMEAANLGAYVNGFTHPGAALGAVLDTIKAAPRYDDERWLSTAFAARAALGKAQHPVRAWSVGIPTWFYGHEPPNVFATHIAKYFANSIREDGMLAIALGGVIFARGNAGTVQEIFQDACQNYYRSVSQAKSAMIVLEPGYWNPQERLLHHVGEVRKPAFPLLEKLATERGFSDYLLLTDDPGEVLRFLESHPPVYQKKL